MPASWSSHRRPAVAVVVVVFCVVVLRVVISGRRKPASIAAEAMLVLDAQLLGSIGADEHGDDGAD